MAQLYNTRRKVHNAFKPRMWPKNIKNILVNNNIHYFDRVYLTTALSKNGIMGNVFYDTVYIIIC